MTLGHILATVAAFYGVVFIIGFAYCFIAVRRQVRKDRRRPLSMHRERT